MGERHLVRERPRPSGSPRVQSRQGTDEVHSQPIFYGPDGAVFAMLHEPVGPARGAVVLCPPLGYEAVCAQAAYVRLGDQLADRGLRVLRPDYPGTGNSLGPTSDDDLVPAWLEAVRDGVDLLREAAAGPVDLVGIRFGATLAATVAATHPDVGRLVLWDPVVSGRRQIRAMKLMAAADPLAPPTGSTGLTIAGLHLGAATVASLNRLAIDVGAVAEPALWIAPQELTELDPALADPALDVRRLPGTHDLLDTDVELAVLPSQILDAITDWLSAPAAGVEATPPPARETPPPRTVEVVDGVEVGHEAGRIGDEQLFATFSARPGATPDLAVVMVNNGTAGQVGPGRSWVEWGRRLAADGYLVVRGDVSGIGESPARPGARGHDSYPIAAGEDIAAMVAAARERGASHVSLVGLCSGGLLAFDAVVAGARVDAIVAINPRFDKAWVHRYSERRRRAAGRTFRPLAFALRKGPLFPLFDQVPTFVWRILDRLHLVASPMRAFERVAPEPTRIRLVFGPDEWGLRALRRRSRADFAQILQGDRVTLDVVADLDHSMFRIGPRHDAFAVVHRILDEPRPTSLPR